MVGGFLGTVLVGFLADPHAMAEGAPASLEANGAGLFLGGNGKLLGVQVICALAMMTYSFVVSGLIGLVIKKTMGIRVSTAEELRGIDLVEHAESGYDFSSVRYSSLVLPKAHAHHEDAPRPDGKPARAVDTTADKEEISA